MAVRFRARRALVVESLEARDMGADKLRLWLEGADELTNVRTRGLRDCSLELANLRERRLLALPPGSAERSELALQACRSKGLARAGANAVDRLGEAPLQAAAARGRSRRDLELLLEARADLSAANKYGETALHLAARFGHVEAVRALTELGANIDAGDKKGDTPLHHAAHGGSVATIEALVALGADVNAMSDGQGAPALPIHRAATEGHVPALEALLRLGADLKDPATARALGLAARYGRVNCIQALVSQRADPRSAYGEDHTPMHYAAIGGYPAAVELLASLGADVNAVSAFSKTTPLQEAERCKCEAAAAALRRLGARLPAAE